MSEKNLLRLLTIGVITLSLVMIAMNFWLLPPGNGRDELELLQVIDFYHSQKRFPELPDDWVDSSWSAHHPPLYFVVMAALIELGLPEPQSHTYLRNEFADQEFTPINGYNRVALVAESNWMKPEGKALTWYVLRVVSVLCNLGAIWAVWQGAKLFFGDSWQIGVPVTLAFFALSPQFLQVAVVINNDDFILLFSALSLWMLIHTLRRGLS
ncbi:MAG TPA: hypothetical protein VJZ27_02770, partial [Aggregatilineales bacterium]|nr:hypothetical protein [Aggregatilineales bacterium]